jgi:hypothetical protein
MKSSRNYPEFFAICKAVGKDYKEAVMEFTDGRTDSLRALSDDEYHELYIRARKWQPVKKPDVVTPGDAQRKKLIAIAGNMQWGTNTMEVVGKLNAFLQEKYSKELNEFDEVELNRIVWVFENKIKKDYLKKI